MKCKTSFFIASVLAISALGPAVAFAGTEKVLHSFDGTLVHGSTPQSALVGDTSGNLYGTTSFGGAYSQGTVFKLTLNSKGGWTQSVLYSFKGGSDGAYPDGSLVFDASGNLYGTTAYGGASSCNNYYTGCGTVFKLAPSSAGWTETVLYSFQGGTDGSLPEASLVLDSAGNLYGTTVSGGSISNAKNGIVFELTPTSSGQWSESILHTFGSANDGAEPIAGLIFDAAGNLYGTTAYGGSSGNGTVFELTQGSKGKWGESILYNFAGGTDGSSPEAPLIFDSVGDLYSTTSRGGGTNGCGTVFELKPNGNSSWSESLLHTFGSTSGDGASPVAGLTFDQAGNLYGTTVFGGGSACSGTAGSGVVFQLAPSSGGQWTETILYNFGSAQFAANLYAGLILQGGNLYGTTGYGGSASLGSVFKLSQGAGGSWTENTIYWFPGGNGANPSGTLVADSAGIFYGTTSYGGLYQHGTVFEISPKAEGGWTTTLIYSFKGSPDGSSPYGGLIIDSAGNLYGTTVAGGTGTLCSTFGGCGTVFKITPSAGKWTENVLHSFQGGNDGALPYAGLTFSQGNLFGVSATGGLGGSGCYWIGCGVVFELTPAGGQWTERILYSFTGGSDSGIPWGSLAADSRGNLFGTTTYTGCDGCVYYATAFEISPNGRGGWTEKTIYTFADLGVSYAGLTLDKAGNLYGTTALILYGPLTGYVFELTPANGKWTKTNLYDFTGGPDGGYPNAGVMFDSAGNLYGTTTDGGDIGCVRGCGVAFALSPGPAGQWSETVLHAFGSFTGDGSSPNGGVILDATGNLYGTTQGGGAYSGGTVYKVTR